MRVLLSAIFVGLSLGSVPWAENNSSPRTVRSTTPPAYPTVTPPAGKIIPIAATRPETSPPELSHLQITLIRGDTRDGSRIHLRIAGDSLQYQVTRYTPDSHPTESKQNVFLSAHRHRALNNVMGRVPGFRNFGSCYGPGMRFYLVETETVKFYRSVPERAGKCFIDEPGIFSVFEDLDDLLQTPGPSELQAHSAS